MTANDLITTDEATIEIVPAKDRVTEDKLLEILDRNDLERKIDIDLIAEYKEDPRYGDRWHMQKAICLILTDFQGEITLAELAYVVDTWFNKPNYGIRRAKTDVNKFRRKAFNCQHASVESESNIA